MAEVDLQPVDKRPARVAAMFDAIAGRYDLLNHLLSGGLDWWWRARAVRAARFSGTERLLDLCTGTGDLARAAACARPGPASVVAADFAGAMLARAREKLRRRRVSVPAWLVQADARRLPVGDGSVDVVTIGFGIRNVDDVIAAARELRRVLKPGGRLVMLEFALPERRWLRRAYLVYFRRVLPVIGRLVSSHPDAYWYLPASVSAFQTPGQLCAILSDAGFVSVATRPLSGGIVWMYVAVR